MSKKEVSLEVEKMMKQDAALQQKTAEAFILAKSAELQRLRKQDAKA
ncbi:MULTISPECIES: hypothetical protein [Deinococcus]|uniref:Uncharacterized protein n=1 Tax=Deinococcus rufus TaxID=2136097 RepID=A0ABV7Z8N9_9DEIO|nr:hypothetical protein [Deinococcus sp. AB2017081]WQE94420.1 hypothetical protein U2P90_13525 [Deinococcus sp. AB2017081]